jgi:hypothetical protein
MRPGEFKILRALMNERKGLTYTELKETTKLSNPVLSEYLTGFMKEGMILKNLEDRRYSLAAGYKPKENFKDFDRALRIFMRNIPHEGARIAMVADQDLRKKIYEDFFHFHIDNVSILLVMQIRNSLIQLFKDNIEKEQDLWQELQTLRKENAKKKLAEQIVKKWEAEVVQYHSIIQEKMLNWFIPYVQMLALAYMANYEFTLSGIDSELPQRFSKEYVRKTFWFTQLENIDQEQAKRDPKIAELLKKKEQLERELEKEEAE